MRVDFAFALSTMLIAVGASGGCGTSLPDELPVPSPSPDGGSVGTSSGGEPQIAGGGTTTASAAGAANANAGTTSAGAGGAMVPGAAGQSGSAQGGSSGSGGSAGSGGQPQAPQEPIVFGTTLDPREQMLESQQLAKAQAHPGDATWCAKGDQHRTYHFDAAGTQAPYRLFVPPTWDGSSPLRLVMFLHGASNDESSYVDQNNKQMLKLAEQHGYLLVSPLGYQGTYGNLLRLPATFGKPTEAQQMLAAQTAETRHAAELSEKDVINVLELVLNEYPIDREQLFLTGHSMGSGGTWYLGAKYASYWAALAPMSGPFVLQDGYPWSVLRDKPLFVTEGTAAATLAASRALRDWLNTGGFHLKYQEVTADHPGMVPLVLPGVFDFFDHPTTP